MRLFYLLLLFLISWNLQAQRVLLIEKLNSAQTTKLYAGSYIQYRIVGDDSWYGEHIYDLRDDTQSLVFPNHYVPISEITMLRQRRPAVQGLGITLITFGLSWSGYAAIGTATDNDPNTNYRTSDAIVTAVASGTGLLLPALFGTKRMRFGEGERLRLRIIDITF
ncbi:MAG: hypothetical protein AAFN81_33570 [Bacteroidota bacterium]